MGTASLRGSLGAGDLVADDQLIGSVAEGFSACDNALLIAVPCTG